MLPMRLHAGTLTCKTKAHRALGQSDGNQGDGWRGGVA